MQQYDEFLPLSDFMTDDMSVFDENTLFFDIETTGLSPVKAQIYCIGCAAKESDLIHISLLFADTPDQETEILLAFDRLLSEKHRVLTFNGTTFDMPFIEKRAQRHGLPLSFDGRESVDLFRDIRKMKHLLQLPDYKQKTLEQFLGCFRRDPFTGGELIAYYQQYLAHPDPALYDALILHNLEDVKGMLGLLKYYAYRDFLDGHFDVRDVSFCCDAFEGSPGISVTLKLAAPVPQPICNHSAYYTLLLDHDNGILTLPVHQNALRHYFADYKNYYYLPEEHTIVHKHVGIYVDPEHREKATRKNCFLEKECIYLTGNKTDKAGYLKTDEKDHFAHLDLGSYLETAGPDKTLTLKQNSEFKKDIREFLSFFDFNI